MPSWKFMMRSIFRLVVSLRIVSKARGEMPVGSMKASPKLEGDGFTWLMCSLPITRNSNDIPFFLGRSCLCSCDECFIASWVVLKKEVLGKVKLQGD